MRKKKLHRGLISLGVALAILLSLPGGLLVPDVSATSSSEIKTQIDELKDEKADLDAQIAALRNKLSQNAEEMEEIVEQKNLIDQEIALLHQQYTNTNAQIAAYSVLIADKQDELAEAEAHHAELTLKNKARLRAMEEEGPLSYWSVIFKANSFVELLDRLNMVEEIAAADQRRMEELKASAKAVSDAKASLEEEAAALEEVKAQQEATSQELDTKRQEADKLLTELIAKEAQFQAEMDRSEQLQENLMTEIANKEADYDKAKYQEWLATSVPSGATGAGVGGTVGSATWLVPISYTRMTSPFGYRWHPLSGKWKMHQGVDLAAPMGTPIYATRSGVVTTASYQEGGAGWYVQLDHGDGYRSIYMHMTHYIVSYGQYVSAGQVIGYCGSSGGSTGPHLHFGISYNGTYVNPANYIGC